ncbi:MAG: hypothetical protein AVO33_07915 [delta proteobacterium ML8_F1]|nr:MAG: hypothetical protein AVO33_07915 [delta proteobacterium ML8_F1]
MSHNNHYVEKDIDKSFDMDLIKRLYSYTRPYFIPLLTALILLIGVTGVDLLKPYIIKVVIDDHIAPQTIYLEADPEGAFTFEGTAYSLGDEDSETKIQEKTFMGPGGNKALSDEAYAAARSLGTSAIYRYVLIFLGALILGLLFNYLQIYLLNHVGQKIVYQLRSDLFEHVEGLSLRFFEKNPIGRLVTRITNDMNNVSEMYTNVAVTFIKDLLLITGIVVIMFSLSVKLTLVSLSTVILVILASMIFRVLARKAYRDVRLKLARINATLSENISGMKIIQLFNQEKRKIAEFDTINREHYEASKKEVQVFAVFSPTVNFFYSISLALILFFGGKWVLDGSLKFGVLVAFTSYIQQFYHPIFDLTEKFNIFQSAMASLERIFLLMDEDDRIPQKTGALPLEKITGNIEFKNVGFAYKKDEPVLKDISFSVRPGETIAFVGATGSGKTTIMNLLTRMYDIQEGQILIDSHPIDTLNLKDLRRHVRTVLQDVFLFSGTIEKNITLYDDFTPEEIKSVSDFVNASKFIDELPGGYQAEVTEGGATLSSGQRQLLSFARALIHSPDILILDEATSSIDTETEELIQDAIAKLITGRTTFVVAHRLSTIKNASRIIVLHQGRIRETGTHDELLKLKGFYYNLYQLQYA